MRLVAYSLIALFCSLVIGCSLTTSVNIINNTSVDLEIELGEVKKVASGEEVLFSLPYIDAIYINVVYGKISDSYILPLIDPNNSEAGFFSDSLTIQINEDRKFYVVKNGEVVSSQPMGYPLEPT